MSYKNLTNIANKLEHSTFSNYDQVQQVHYHLDWIPDFQEKLLAGSVLIDFVILQPTDRVILDGRSLSIFSIFLQDTPLEFKIENANKIVNEAFPSQKITIFLPEILKPGHKFQILIRYQTAAGQKCSALSWMEAGQTNDQIQPFMYSQFQEIHARACLPCMDHPGKKITYSARVDTRNDQQICLMSGILQAKHGNVYEYSQNIPIPTYLIAIVVGHLASATISDRCQIWAEPSVVPRAQSEFENTETYLQIAEKLTNMPYLWGRYDLLILPNSFPWGGMENPCLTFANENLIVGDKSLANVIAHEISHSWTGNLLGCETWEHFWLNEGWTMYLERQILYEFEKMENNFPANSKKLQQFDDLNSLLGLAILKLEITSLNQNNSPNFTKLVLNLQGIDLDDSYSRIPYEKGYLFLKTLENAVGGRDHFLKFLQYYLQKFKFHSLTSMEFMDTLFEFFGENFKQCRENLQQLDYENFFNAVGMPNQILTLTLA